MNAIRQAWLDYSDQVMVEERALDEVTFYAGAVAVLDEILRLHNTTMDRLAKLEALDQMRLEVIKFATLPFRKH
jgi:hypothetical protein